MQALDLRSTRTTRITTVVTIAFALSLIAANASVLAQSRAPADDAEDIFQIRNEIAFLEDNWHIDRGTLFGDEAGNDQNPDAIMWSDEAWTHDL